MHDSEIGNDSLGEWGCDIFSFRNDTTKNKYNVEHLLCRKKGTYLIFPVILFST